MLELCAEGSTLEELLSSAAVAVGALVQDAGGEPDRVPMLVESEDVESLLTGFLDDLLYLVEVEHFAVERVERLELDGTNLRAALSGRTGIVSTLDYETFELTRDAGVWRLCARLA